MKKILIELLRKSLMKHDEAYSKKINEFGYADYEGNLHVRRIYDHACSIESSVARILNIISDLPFYEKEEVVFLLNKIKILSDIHIAEIE